MGELKLSALNLLMPLVSTELLWWRVGCSSASGVGGQAPGRVAVERGISSLVGCDDKGPPPEVGGRDRRGLLFCLWSSGRGDGGGESSGAGMLVPWVRE